MIDYLAPNPYQVKGSGFWNFFSSFGSFSQSIEQSIGQLILPAQWRETQQISERELRHFAHRSNLTIDLGFIGTHDGAFLDTIEISSKNNQSSIEDQRFIIKFNGNGGQYEDLIPSYASDAQKLGMTVVGFNYRGVGNSQKVPDTFQDLITDGIAQVQRLLDKGVKPEHVLLDGHSLGGGIATMVAEHFHKKGFTIYLWNDRSFASISKAAAGILAPNLPGILGNAFESSFETTSWSVMKPSGWDRDIASAYNAIPEPYKGYMVVAKRSEKSAGDGVISHQASLHKTVRKQEKQHNISTGHKVFCPLTFWGGHNSDRRELISKNNPTKNAQELFEEFAHRLKIR